MPDGLDVLRQFANGILEAGADNGECHGSFERFQRRRTRRQNRGVIRSEPRVPAERQCPLANHDRVRRRVWLGGAADHARPQGEHLVADFSGGIGVRSVDQHHTTRRSAARLAVYGEHLDEGLEQCVVDALQ